MQLCFVLCSCLFVSFTVIIVAVILMKHVINGDGTVNCLGRCSVLVAGIYGVALLQFFLLRE